MADIKRTIYLALVVIALGAMSPLARGAPRILPRPLFDPLAVVIRDTSLSPPLSSVGSMCKWAFCVRYRLPTHIRPKDLHVVIRWSARLWYNPDVNGPPAPVPPAISSVHLSRANGSTIIASLQMGLPGIFALGTICTVTLTDIKTGQVWRGVAATLPPD